MAGQLGTTTRVSIDSAGGEANGLSIWPSISADGRYVAFQSNASNLVADDTNEAGDIFVHDLQLGTTTRVNVDSAGGQANGGNSGIFPSISADGRYVAFSSFADNLVPGDTNGASDIFVRDLELGTTTRVSVDSAGGQAFRSSDVVGGRKRVISPSAGVPDPDEVHDDGVPADFMGEMKTVACSEEAK